MAWVQNIKPWKGVLVSLKEMVYLRLNIFGLKGTVISFGQPYLRLVVDSFEKGFFIITSRAYSLGSTNWASSS